MRCIISNRFFELQHPIWHSTFSRDSQQEAFGTMNPTQTHAVRPQNPGKSLTIASWILQILAAAAFFAAGGAKLTGAPAMVAVFDKIGVGQWFLYVTGVLEVVGAIGLLVPRTALYAAVLLACVMAGAILAHIT